MKKLAIVVLLVVAGCSRKANVATSPTRPGPEITSSGGSGAIGPREAVQGFMAAAKAQDIQAMADIWGTKEGPARGNMPTDEMEKRLLYIMRCMRHDSYSIVAESPGMGRERMYSVEVRRGPLAPKANFWSTPGPENRWYLRDFELEKLNSICAAK
ncbi:MAG: hypothetical protein ACRENU_10155 [Gemmatimonadaceae bacterium]